MVRVRTCGGRSHSLYTTEVYRGHALLYVLVAEKSRGLPRTNNADDSIQSERYRRHWSGGRLNTIDRGVAENYQDRLANVSSLRDQR